MTHVTDRTIEIARRDDPHAHLATCALVFSVDGIWACFAGGPSVMMTLDSLMESFDAIELDAREA